MSQGENNDTLVLVCLKPPWFMSLGDFFLRSYDFVLPIFLVVGLLGHSICLRAFFRQANTEKAYVYQIYVTTAETIQVSVFTCFILGHQWSGVEHNGLKWYQQNYVLMFWAAHMGIPLANAMSVITLLLSVSMAADRVFAFTKPFVYKNIKHKLHQRTALASSILIGFSSTFYNAFLFQVDGNAEAGYQISTDIPYVTSISALVLAYVCNAARIGGLLALIGNNLALVRFYKKRVIHVANMNQGGKRDGQREAQRKAAEKNLVRLTLAQSFFTAISMFSYIAFYTAVYTVPTFNFCESHLFGPLLDVVLMCSDSASTCVTVMINKKSRKLILNAFKCCKKWKIVLIKVDQANTSTAFPVGSTAAPTATGPALPSGSMIEVK